MRTINSKDDYFPLWQQGILGNTLRVWDSVAALKKDNYGGWLSARVKRAAGGGYTQYNIKSIYEAELVVQDWVRQGIPENEIYFNESAPDQYLITQGELMRSTNFLEYFHSTEQTKMRIALERGKQLSGLKAKMYLQGIMTPASYDDVQDLLNEYPDHIIELGVYERCLGYRPGRNTLIWEIRKY